MQDRPAHAGAPRAIGEFARRLTEKPLGRRGFAEAGLIAEWPVIVGQDQARGSLPLKIAFPAGERSGGTLHVRVASGGLAMEFHHREPLILARINAYFGYGAVTRIRITQGPVPPRPARRKPPPPPELPPDREQDLQDRLSAIDDPELRAALARLGRSIG
jgi:hypothetical protein